MKFPKIPRLVRRVGIDLGSSRVRIWVDAGGLIVDEPACIAIENASQRVVAVGTDAEEMEGRVGEHISIHYPVIGGELYDGTIGLALLKVLLQRELKRVPLISPVIMASVPSLSTQTARQAMTELMYDLGAGEVYTISQPLAASIGSGVPIADASGSFFLHMGAGVVEGVVISLGSIVSAVDTKYAGMHVLERLQFSLKKEHGIVVSRSEASKLLKSVVSVTGSEGAQSLVAGQDVQHGNPKEVAVKASDFLSEITLIADRYLNVLTRLLSKLPPELTSDVIDKGLLLSGGLAQLTDFTSFATTRLGVPVSVVENSDLVVIHGISTALEHLDLFRESLGYSQEARGVGV
ncbi:MAG: rod shape-determining protein [Microgenomates group bacterium]